MATWQYVPECVKLQLQQRSTLHAEYVRASMSFSKTEIGLKAVFEGLPVQFSFSQVDYDSQRSQGEVDAAVIKENGSLTVAGLVNLETGEFRTMLPQETIDKFIDAARCDASLSAIPLPAGFNFAVVGNAKRLTS